MKKLMLLVVVLLVAGAVFAGEGKSCDRNAAKNVQLTGTIESGEGDARLFRVADGDRAYTICEESTADLAKLGGAKVKVTGKLVACGGGTELLIDKVAEI
jgi:hypothetical protein